MRDEGSCERQVRIKISSIVCNKPGMDRWSAQEVAYGSVEEVNGV
jgi:hypothetical protein